MALRVIDAAAFEETINSGKLVIVDFFAGSHSGRCCR